MRKLEAKCTLFRGRTPITLGPSSKMTTLSVVNSTSSAVKSTTNVVNLGTTPEKITTQF